MAFSKKERESYNQYRDRVSRDSGITKNEYNRLRRVAQGLHRADEDSASGRKDWRENPSGRGSKEYSEKEYKKDVNSHFAKTKALKGKVHLYHQSDPRGASLYIGKKRLNQANYDSEGRHIY